MFNYYIDFDMFTARKSERIIWSSDRISAHVDNIDMMGI